MRFGLVVDALDEDAPLDDLIARARAAEAVGFDLVWLDECSALPAPTVAAAALAPHTTTVRIGTAVTAGVNPVYLAEEAAVADLCLGGRLVLGVGTAADADAGLLAETVDVLLAATAARPFAHAGERWRIPANLAENVTNREDRVRVTPATAQLELPIWLTGPHAEQVGTQRCLTFVGTGDADELAGRWRRAGAHLGAAVHRLRRVAVRTVDAAADGTVDDEAIVRLLAGDYRAWGLDVALLRLPVLTRPARERALNRIAAHVVPRLQLDRLPPGLERYWARRQETT